MISIVCCISDQKQFNDFCKPTLEKTAFDLKKVGLDLEIISLHDASSIFEAYNRGIKQAKFQVKVFIHQDVNLLDTSWAFKLLSAFANYPQYGLIGLVGTQKFQDSGFWWASGQQYIVGEVFSGAEKANWVFRAVRDLTPVECIDGFFIATNRSIPFDESLEGFHLYDMDYSRTMTKLGYKIGIIPHKAWHIGAIRKQDTDKYFARYNKKWNLD